MPTPDQLTVPPTFITLGPEGTDHENATQWYLGQLGLLEDAKISLVSNLVKDGLPRLKTEPNSMLVQCAAHQQVNEINMNPGEVFMVDAFMHPTMELGVLARTDVPTPRTMGLMEATRAYLEDPDTWEITHEPSKPVVTEGLLAGRYDAGVTFTKDAYENPEQLRVIQMIGEIPTAWVVFANRPGPDTVGLIGRTGGDFYLDAARQEPAT
jgi:hypothetical protein